MRFSRRLAAIVLAVAAVSFVVAGGVIAGSRSSDETALRPARSAPDRGIEQRVNALLGKLTLDEKLQQIQLLADWQINNTEAANRWAPSSA
jgi:beta-glucosidase